MNTVEAKKGSARREAPVALSIATLTLCAFALTTAEFVIAGILPDVATGMSVQLSSAGRLVTAYALGMAIGAPFLTVATARLPRKGLAVALLAVFVVGNVVAALAPTYLILLATRSVCGLVVGTFFAIAVVTAGSLAAPGKQASAIAKVALGFNLAMVLGAPIGTVIDQHFSWRATFVMIAAFATVALVLFAKLVPAGRGPFGSVLGELKVLKGGRVQLALATTAVGNVGVLAVFTYLAPLLTHVSGFSKDTVPIILLIYGVGATVGSLVGGWLSDRALMPSTVGLLAALAGVLALEWLLSPFSNPTAAMMFVIGVLASSVIPGMQTRILATASASPTLGITLNASAYQCAAALAAWLGGQVIDRGPGLRAIYVLGAAITLCGVAVSCLSWSTDRSASRIAMSTSGSSEGAYK
jgi:DHA1 family inner membrane transport protein